jgi:hypothetical protein
MRVLLALLLLTHCIPTQPEACEVYTGTYSIEHAEAVVKAALLGTTSDMGCVK